MKTDTEIGRCTTRTNKKRCLMAFHEIMVYFSYFPRILRTKYSQRLSENFQTTAKTEGAETSQIPADFNPVLQRPTLPPAPLSWSIRVSCDTLYTHNAAMYFKTAKQQAIWDNFPKATQIAMEREATLCPKGFAHIFSINTGFEDARSVGIVWENVSKVHKPPQGCIT